MLERVAVTGMSAITAYGFGCAALLSGVLSGKPAFGPVTRFDASSRRVGVAATLPGSPDLRDLLDEVIASVGPGPVFLAAHQRMGIGERTYTSACVAASTAVADAVSAIAHGEAERVVVAAGYLVEPVQFGLFDAGRALAIDGAVRPFSMGRKGLLLGDGVAAIALEARPKQALAWIDGWGRAGDAYHVCQPRPDGSGLARAIDRAVSRAGHPSLDYINAHGSGSPQSDAAEANALPRGVPVSSTKSLHGQALEASPLIELITTILAMNEGALPVNAGYLGPDPACPVSVILDEPQVGDVRHALVVNAAFGGANTALVVSAPSTSRNLPGKARSIGPTSRALPGNFRDHGPNTGALPGKMRDLEVVADARVSNQESVPQLAGFIASSFSPLAAEAARRCLSLATPGPETAVIIVSPDGDVETLRAASAEGRISPLLFFQAVPNAVAGHIAAKWDLRGPVVCLEEPAIERGFDVARIIIRDGDAAEALVIFVADGARAVLVRGDRP